MRSPTPAVAAAALVLAACATGHRSPQTPLPAAFEAPTPVADAIDLDRWWLAFGDPQLTELVDEALVRGWDVRIAAARLAEARAVRTSALTAFLPQGDLTGSGSKTHSELLEGTEINIPGVSTGGDSERYQANFNVSWEVDLWGRIFAARRAANADVDAARFAYEGARASLAAAVADAYFQARGLAIQLDDARETSRIRRRLYDILTIRAERGLVATADADRVAADVASADSQVAALESELQAARRSLLVLVGRGVDPLASLPIEAGVGEAPAAPRTLPGELLARRPDVREAEARFRGQLGRKALAAKAFFPTLTLTPGVGLSRQVQPNFQATNSNWTIGANVSVPVLDIPRLLADLHAQDARTEQAALTYEQTVQGAYRDAENALVQLESDRRRVALLTAGEVRARRAYEAARTRYQMGLIGLEEALSAEQTWRQLRVTKTAAQVQAVRRAVQTYQAVGGGWPSGLAQAGGGT